MAARPIDRDGVARIGDGGVHQPEAERDGVDAGAGIDALVAGERGEAVVARCAGFDGAVEDVKTQRLRAGISNTQIVVPCSGGFFISGTSAPYAID